MNNLGIGSLLGMLTSDNNTIAACREVMGKTISSITMLPDAHEDGSVMFEFSDGASLELYDTARSCCESRYMSTDDKLTDYIGAKLRDLELRDVDCADNDDGDVHEVQFLVAITDKGNITFATHNKHNGYYGGFCIAATAGPAHAAADRTPEEE